MRAWARRHPLLGDIATLLVMLLAFVSVVAVIALVSPPPVMAAEGPPETVPPHDLVLDAPPVLRDWTEVPQVQPITATVGTLCYKGEPTAWVQFRSTSPVPLQVSVAGHETTVEPDVYHVVQLTRTGPDTFALGPLVLLSANRPLDPPPGVQVDALGDYHATPCQGDAASAAETSLPVTGSHSADLIGIGLLLCLAGIGFLAINRLVRNYRRS